MKDALAEQGGKNAVNKGFGMILLDGRHRCCAVRQLKVGGAQTWTDRSPHTPQVIRRDPQATGNAEWIMFLQMTNTSIAIVRTNQSLMPESGAELRGAFKIKYSVPFVNARIKDIIKYMMLPQYLLEQSRSSYIRYVRLGCLKTKNAERFPLLESLNEIWVNGTKLRITHFDSKLLYVSRARFVFLLTKEANFHISNLAKSMAFPRTHLLLCRQAAAAIAVQPAR